MKLVAVLLATVCVGAVPPELITNVSLLLSRYYTVDCMHIFRTDDLPLSLTNEIHKLWRGLAVTESRMTTGIYTYRKYLERKKVTVRKTSCYRSLKIMADDRGSSEGYAAFSKIFSIKDAVWVLFTESLSTDFFKGAHVMFDDFIIIAVVKTSELVELHEMYRVAEGHPLKILPLGNWTSAGGLSLDNNTFYDRRSDLEGVVLRAGSVENWPASYTKNGKWEGLLVKVWEEIQSLINCTSVHVQTDNIVGVLQENGSWNGLVGMAMRDEIDVLVSEMVINKERSHVIRFLYPIMRSRYQIYTRHLGYVWQWDSVLKPFSADVWLAAFAWVLVATAFFAFTYRRCFSYGLESWNDEKEFTPFRSFLFVIQALSQQGHHVTPNAFSCRVLFFVAYAVSGVLIPSYSASLVSSLAQKIHYKSFDSLEEMVDDGTYRLLIKQNTAQYAFFANSKDEFFKKAFRTLTLTVPEDRKKWGLREAIKSLCYLDKYAVIGIEEIVEVRLPRMTGTHCTIVPLTYPVSTVYLTMATSKQNPFWGLINHHLGRLLINGIVERQKRLEFPHTEGLNPKQERDVGMRQLISAFVFMAFFTFISILVLLLEIQHHLHAMARARFRRKKRGLQSKQLFHPYKVPVLPYFPR